MKKLHLIILIVISLLLLISNIGHSQSATNEQIVDLLKVMDAENQFVESMETMAEMQKDNPQTAMLPEGFYEELIKEAKDGFKSSLLPKLMEIYKNNLTFEEAKQLIEFYKTDLGQLMLTKMPQIQVESANVGMIWGQELGMQVAQRLMSKE